MQGKELLTTRRSIRSYKEDKVSKEVIEEIISMSAYAPSWKNTQISRYVVIEGVKKQEIANNCVGEHNRNIINSAPVLVALTAIKSRSGYERDGSYTTKKEDRWQNFDAGVAAQTFCLAAHELGLGTVIMGMFDEDKVKELIQLEPEKELMALISLGYPAEEPQAPKRKTVQDLLTYLD